MSGVSQEQASGGALGAFRLVPLAEEHRHWASELLVASWGDTRVVSRGNLIDAIQLPGFVAIDGPDPIGLLTYRLDGDECEVVTLNSLVEGRGVGTALIEAARAVAEAAGCRRLWLITTNDNTPGLRFYQKRGFRLVAVHRNAIEESRRLKPRISLIGLDGIPLRDEIELELLLERSGCLSPSNPS
jgi:ribosomal protein S18 acetylase RimI-like enzyme